MFFLCVLCSVFRHLTLFFGEFSIPASIRLGTQMRWRGATSFSIFSWYFPLYTKLNLSQKGILVNTGTPVFTQASNEFFRQLFGFPQIKWFRPLPTIFHLFSHHELAFLDSWKGAFNRLGKQIKRVCFVFRRSRQKYQKTNVKGSLYNAYSLACRIFRHRRLNISRTVVARILIRPTMQYSCEY